MTSNEKNHRPAPHLKAWHVSTRHIVAAPTADEALSYARSIEISEENGLFAEALELTQAELDGPCWTGPRDEYWWQASIGSFLAETFEPRLLCETLQPARHSGVEVQA